VVRAPALQSQSPEFKPSHTKKKKKMKSYNECWDRQKLLSQLLGCYPQMGLSCQPSWLSLLPEAATPSACLMLGKKALPIGPSAALLVHSGLRLLCLTPSSVHGVPFPSLDTENSP
jgi:hypothetical protein